jgi:hypothetical protein
MPPSGREIKLLARQLADLVRANDRIEGITLAILARLAIATRRSRENRRRARAAPPRMGLRHP